MGTGSTTPTRAGATSELDDSPGTAEDHRTRDRGHSPLRIVRLYFRLLGTHLRGAMEYRADFWIMMLAAVLTQAVGVVLLTAIFRLIPDLNGWSLWPILIMFGMVTVGEGVGSLCFEGMWRVAELINQGELDYMLVRPYPVLLQVSSSEIGLNGLGNLTTGVAMLVLGIWHSGIHWTVAEVAVGLILLAGGITVKIAISLATNSVSFWVASPSPLFAMAVHQAGELTRYPLTLFPPVLRVALTVVIPFAFVGFYPADYLTGSHALWIVLATPAVAGYCLLLAVSIFRRGMLRYESTGS
ncbi:ABC transporter permease [Actinospica robiniae]|uniref:ABC transporter permease n=1 Tax=Actinospica robiniae TaxID=304901 RepID=UPI00040E4081|nr:ABC-2 family transporter protein [Actinospica robiniae]